jgi:hypothetical protein
LMSSSCDSPRTYDQRLVSANDSELASAKPFKTHKNKRKFLLEFRERSGEGERERLTDDLLIYDSRRCSERFEAVRAEPDFTSVCFVFASFLSRAAESTTKPRGKECKKKKNFGLWRREEHKNNESFKLAVDDGCLRGI